MWYGNGRGDAATFGCGETPVEGSEVYPIRFHAEIASCLHFGVGIIAARYIGGLDFHHGDVESHGHVVSNATEVV